MKDFIPVGKHQNRVGNGNEKLKLKFKGKLLEKLQKIEQTFDMILSR